MTISLVPPNSQSAISGSDGLPTRPMYQWMVNVQRRVDSISSGTTPTPPSGEFLPITSNVVGNQSILVYGSLASGIAIVSLDGDVQDALVTQYYGSDGTGTKGWYNISDTILTTTLAKTVNTDGTVSIDLATLADDGGGSLQKFSRDTYGRVAGTSAATTDDLSEGSTNLYFTNTRVAAALAAGPGINLSTDGSGVTTISDASLTLADLTDQTGDNLTSQSLVQLTANSTVGSVQILLAFTLSTLPSAMTYQHGVIFVTDLTGAAAPCYSDGTNWRRFSDNSIAS